MPYRLGEVTQVFLRVSPPRRWPTLFGPDGPTRCEINEAVVSGCSKPTLCQPTAGHRLTERRVGQLPDPNHRLGQLYPNASLLAQL